MSSVSKQLRHSPTKPQDATSSYRLRLIQLTILLVIAAGLLVTGLTTTASLPRELYAAGAILLSVSILHQLRQIQEAK